MARPKKQTVDYFSHDTDASQGRTLTILQSKYGNDGYSFWYKMLELLGRSPGHYYLFQNPSDWEFLLAKTHVSADNNARDILDTLVLLGAIDEELYQQGCIWCQNFIDRLDDVYRRRREETPQKPIIVNNKVVSVPIVSTETELLSEETPQSKVKESKVKDINKENNKRKYGEFANVLLTLEEYNKLTERFGGIPAGSIIEQLSAYLASRGKRYKSHYAVLLMWKRNDDKKGKKGPELSTEEEIAESIRGLE